MQRFLVEITIRDTGSLNRDRVTGALEAALEHSTAREALDEALFSALHVNDDPECEQTPGIAGLRIVARPRDSDTGYVLFDFDAHELLSKTIYVDYDEAVEDARRVDDVIVVPFHAGRNGADLATLGQLEGRSYGLSIDGPSFRAQRELLAQLAESSQQQIALTLSPGQIELLEGLVNLTDAIADQAADRYGIECLL